MPTEWLPELVKGLGYPFVGGVAKSFWDRFRKGREDPRPVVRTKATPLGNSAAYTVSIENRSRRPILTSKVELRDVPEGGLTPMLLGPRRTPQSPPVLAIKPHSRSQVLTQYISTPEVAKHATVHVTLEDLSELKPVLLAGPWRQRLWEALPPVRVFRERKAMAERKATVARSKAAGTLRAADPGE